jgi:hypothetical protein
MAQLIVSKVDDRTICIRDNRSHSVKICPAVFMAWGNTDTRAVYLQNVHTREIYFAYFDEIEVDGKGVLSSLEETVSALNAFVGNFRGAGGTATPTLLRLKPFAAGVGYKANEPILENGSIWVAIADFTCYCDKSVASMLLIYRKNYHKRALGCSWIIALRCFWSR